MTHYKDVKEFMTVFGQQTPDALSSPSLDIIKLRLRLTGSRPNWILSHLWHADELINELAPEDLDVDLVEVADAITDIDYVNTGAAIAFGFNLDDTFDEVHRSNMSKLGLDGKPIYNEFGKVQKGSQYVRPNLKTVLYPENGL